MYTQHGVRYGTVPCTLLIKYCTHGTGHHRAPAHRGMGNLRRLSLSSLESPTALARAYFTAAARACRALVLCDIKVYTTHKGPRGYRPFIPISVCSRTHSFRLGTSDSLRGATGQVNADNHTLRLPLIIDSLRGLPSGPLCSDGRPSARDLP